jgi:hypothetical protein
MPASAMMPAISSVMPHQPEFVVLPDATLRWPHQHQKYGRAQFVFLTVPPINAL